MKKNHLLLFILLLGNLGLKAQETIDNPPYKFRNTALYRIEKVECTDQDTKVYLRTEFIPGWWVQFSKEEINLKDNLGNRYRPLALEGAAWEEQKPTPASGTDHFHLPSFVQRSDKYRLSGGQIRHIRHPADRGHSLHTDTTAYYLNRQLVNDRWKQSLDLRFLSGIRHRRKSVLGI